MAFFQFGRFAGLRGALRRALPRTFKVFTLTP